MNGWVVLHVLTPDERTVVRMTYFRGALLEVHFLVGGVWMEPLRLLRKKQVVL